MRRKKCMQCGESFLGRVDKRFCSDQCRSAFHNRQNSDATNFIRNINATLRRNHRILAELNTEGKTSVHRDRLVEKGFNFRYFTNEYVTKSGNTYRFCYDQGYLERENDFFTLVVRQEYVS